MGAQWGHIADREQRQKNGGAFDKVQTRKTMHRKIKLQYV